MPVCRRLRSFVPFILFVIGYHGLYVVLQTHWNLKPVYNAPTNTPESVSRNLAVKAWREMLNTIDVLSELVVTVEDIDDALANRLELQYNRVAENHRSLRREAETRARFHR